MAARPWLLTTAEIQVFKRDGYFIRRGLLDPELTLRCRDAMWERCDPRVAKQRIHGWKLTVQVRHLCMVSEET